jgi:hypothetical protein
MEMALRRKWAARRAAGMLALAATGASLAAIALPSAHAGQYHVYGCRTPAGQPAPADGWTGSVSPGAPFDDYANNTCSQGGAVIAALGDATGHAIDADRAQWTFAAPQGDTIVAATLFRAGDTAGGGGPVTSYEFWLAGPGEHDLIEPCLASLGCAGKGNPAVPLSFENRVAVAAPHLGNRLFAIASCTGFAGNECPPGAGDANHYAAVIYIFASDITLEQNAGPSATNVGGELASAPILHGTSSVTFAASDPGAGVYEAAVSVDGRLVQVTPLADNGGRCRDVGQAADGKPAFLYVQPCLSSVSAAVALDTTRLSNGAHRLTVSVIDAAGNAALVLDRQVTIANPLSACGSGSAAGAAASSQAALSVSWRGRRSARLLSPFARRNTIVGRLTGPGGVPIAGAAIDLTATPAYPGAKPVVMAGPRTRADGRFSAVLPGGMPSRTVCVGYRSPGAGPQQAVTRTLTLGVRAGVGLAVAPRVTSVGRAITFRGRLRAGPVPAAGKQLVLEARSAGSGWIQFKVVRTNRRGRFHASYRFRFPGPADYRFRAVSEPESDYPFAAGSSNVVSVHER